MPHILDRVMPVDVQVALRHARSMSISEWRRELLQHVIEKPDARIHLRLARAIEIDGNADIGFLRLAVQGRGCGAWRCRAAWSSSSFTHLYLGSLYHSSGPISP
jgi:hypothetical protein